MTAISDTRAITYYLRGLAITAVMANHYVNNYLSNDFRGYANGIIAIFFLLSGYGIFYSLESRLGRNDQNHTKSILKFYLERAIRIYPLFWLALLLDSYLQGSMHYTSHFLAVPYVTIGGPYWFITQIIHCYIIAPFLYIVLRDTGIKGYIKLTLVLALFLYLLNLATYGGNPPHALSYRRLFLGHIILFSLGMALPVLISNYRERLVKNTLKSKALVPVSFVVFLIMVHYIRLDMCTSTYIVKLVIPFLIISAFGFCLFTIARNPKLPLNRLFMLLGTYSYSLYLFHVPFYKALAKGGIVEYGSFQSAGFTVLLFPVFLLLCVLIEKYTDIHKHKIEFNVRWPKHLKR